MAVTMVDCKNTKSYAGFSFVSLGTEDKDVNWFARHSSASRSHAAHWAKFCRRRVQSENQTRVSDRGNTTLTFTSSQLNLSEKGESSQHHITATRPPYRRPRNSKGEIAKTEFFRRKIRHLHNAQHESVGHFFPASSPVAVPGLSGNNVFLF